MDRKIGLEEHFALDETLGDSENFVGADLWKTLKPQLLDIQSERLRHMDENGIEIMILSLNSPAAQAVLDRHEANELTRRANDILAEQIQRRTDRFRGFAALPMQDPDMAARELERCVNELGFKGALVNGYSQLDAADNAIYYDVPSYWPFWDAVQALNVPFYLHPREPSERKAYAGHPWLIGPAFGFGVETALHALRLMGSGLLDRYPSLQFILGHLGESLPFSLYRIDQRIAWSPLGYPAKKKISEYFAENFYVTTAGNFRDQSLVNTLLEVGSDRILFSTDYPFEKVEEAATWFDAAPISEADRQKIGRDNARNLFKL
jgi:predicted TIM-barrel fold metal-dependent hydrolase